MKAEYKSLFSSHIQEMISFKESLGYSKNTYDKFLLNFDRFCSQHYPDSSVLTKNIVMDWGRKRDKENGNGLKRRLIAIREFGKYLNSMCADAYIIPSEMIGSFKPFTPYIYTDDELKTFFKASDLVPPHKLSPLREYTIPVLFRLLYCCGMRPGEVRHLKRSDVNFTKGTLFISDAKMHRDRIIVFTNDTMELCKNYDEIANLVYPDREFFFQNPKGCEYSALWVQNQFRLCWKIAGTTDFHGSRKRVYDFRHNYATRILMKWMDEGKDLMSLIPYLSTYMGHSKLSETVYYIHLLPERLVESDMISWERFECLIPEVN